MCGAVFVFTPGVGILVLQGHSGRVELSSCFGPIRRGTRSLHSLCRCMLLHPPLLTKLTRPPCPPRWLSCSEEEEEGQGNGVEVPSSEEESEQEEAPLSEDEEQVRARGRGWACVGPGVWLGAEHQPPPADLAAPRNSTPPHPSYPKFPTSSRAAVSSCGLMSGGRAWPSRQTWRWHSGSLRCVLSRGDGLGIMLVCIRAG